MQPPDLSSPGTPPEPTRATPWAPPCRICGEPGFVNVTYTLLGAPGVYCREHVATSGFTFPEPIVVAPLAPSSAPRDLPVQEQDEGKTSKSATPPPSQLESRASRDAPVREDEPRRYQQVPNGCWAACIAGLTDIPHDELAALVPQTVVDGYKDSNYHNAVNRLMRSRGWRLAYIGPDVPRGFAIGSGTSPRGAYHAMIVKDGALWHDPHPDGGGVAEFDAFEVVIPLTGPAQ